MGDGSKGTYPLSEGVALYYGFCTYSAWIALAAYPGWRSLRSLTPGYKQIRLRRVWDGLQPSSGPQNFTGQQYIKMKMIERRSPLRGTSQPSQ